MKIENLNASLPDITSVDVPNILIESEPMAGVLLAENQDGTGPYGAKGGGEGSLNPPPACLANALYNATGVRVRRLPLTPERVWRALKERQGID